MSSFFSHPRLLWLPEPFIGLAALLVSRLEPVFIEVFKTVEVLEVELDVEEDCCEESLLLTEPETLLLRLWIEGEFFRGDVACSSKLLDAEKSMTFHKSDFSQKFYWDIRYLV